MLKQVTITFGQDSNGPAAFRRLCVETLIYAASRGGHIPQPPSGGCVLKRLQDGLLQFNVLPAAFRRLCVETLNVK